MQSNLSSVCSPTCSTVQMRALKSGKFNRIEKKFCLLPSWAIKSADAHRMHKSLFVESGHYEFREKKVLHHILWSLFAWHQCSFPRSGLGLEYRHTRVFEVRRPQHERNAAGQGAPHHTPVTCWVLKRAYLSEYWLSYVVIVVIQSKSISNRSESFTVCWTPISMTNDDSRSVYTIAWDKWSWWWWIVIYRIRRKSSLATRSISPSILQLRVTLPSHTFWPALWTTRLLHWISSRAQTAARNDCPGRTLNKNKNNID